jgi:hypothetical protein
MRFWGRVCKLTIFRSNGSALTPTKPGGAVDLNPLAIDRATALEIESDGQGLRIVGAIEKKLVKNPNTCELMAFNLNQATRTFLRERPLTVKVEAGHDNVLRHMYLGDVRFAFSEKEDGTTWKTKIILKDGGRAYANGKISKAYGKNTPVITIVRDCAGAMGLTLPAALEADPALKAGVPRGVTLDDDAQIHLTEHLAPYGYGWSMQNGILQTLRSDQVRDDQAYVVDEDTAGLMGSPQYSVPQKESKPTKLNFKTILWPEIQPGVKVDMRSREVRGLHKVVEVKHDFDTDGDAWETSCEATVFSASAS